MVLCCTCVIKYLILICVDECDLGLGLVDGEDVQLFVLLDGLVDRIRLETLAHAPENVF